LVRAVTTIEADEAVASSDFLGGNKNIEGEKGRRRRMTVQTNFN
jgi:hypothetical protein